MHSSHESRNTSLTFVIQADVSRSIIVTNSYSSNNVYTMASPKRHVFFIDVGKTCKMFHMDEPRILITTEKEFIYERPWFQEKPLFQENDKKTLVWNDCFLFS